MLELMILGFLADGPLHGYELRRRIAQLHGHARSVSDGALYPAIRRLREAGHLTETAEPGRAAAGRRVLHLGESGRDLLRERLRGADGTEISDQSRYFVVLAFLSQLPSPEERRAVLARRLAFLEAARSFFTEDGVPQRSADLEDPYRRGMLTIARASRRAEITWLREQLQAPAPEESP